MLRSIPQLIAGAGLLVLAACGLNEPKFIDYSDDGDGAGDGADGAPPQCTAALAAFDAQMQAIVSGKCAIAGCHTTQPISGKALSANDATTNRAQLLAYTGETSTKLFSKISSSSHGGGNKSADLPVSNIDAWLSEEANCP